MIAIDTYLLLVWNNFSRSIQAVFIKTTSRRKDCCLCQISHLSDSIEKNLCGKIFITGIHNLFLQTFCECHLLPKIKKYASGRIP